MARKKTQEEIDAQNTPVVDNDTAVENVPVVDEKKVDAPADGEIPEYAKRILRIFSNHESLYIGSDGSVYTPDTKPAVYGNAILYKNPFYNNSKINN